MTIGGIGTAYEHARTSGDKQRGRLETGPVFPAADHQLYLFSSERGQAIGGRSHVTQILGILKVLASGGCRKAVAFAANSATLKLSA